MKRQRRHSPNYAAEAKALPASHLKGQPLPYKYAYGIESNRPFTQRQVELIAFRSSLTPENGGLGKAVHLANAIKLTWPDTIWHPWMLARLRSICNEEAAIKIGRSTFRSVGWVGCAAAGKTYDAALIGLAWWLADPWNSILVLTSTTKDMVGRRIWPVISSLARSARDPETGQSLQVGHLIDSEYMILSREGDKKHAVFAMAVAHGETAKAEHNLRGMHAARIMVVVDEANGTPEAIFTAMANMRKGCQDFTLLVIGNALRWSDPHGQICRPAFGTHRLSPEFTLWQTAGVPKWQIEPGMCYHFDGARSPNVLAGETKWPFLYNWEDWELAKRKAGTARSYWEQDRGFWPPEGMTNTVLDEAMIARCDGTGELRFHGESWLCAGLDPAFGGDQCILQFGRIGYLADGRLGLQLLDAVAIDIPGASATELDMAIAQRVVELCKERGVRPDYFAADASGTGRGVFSGIAEKWSRAVHRVEFGGAASDLPASEYDNRPGRDVYSNRVTELWFEVRALMRAGQLKGLGDDAVVEFCARAWDYKGRRLAVEPKADCRPKIDRSPDHADAVAVLVDLARHRGMATAPVEAPPPPDETELDAGASGLYDDAEAYANPEINLADV